MKTFYERDGIKVRASVLSDIELLKGRIKDSDKAEIWASHHHHPEEALRLSIERSVFSATVVDNGRPVAVFGIYADNLLGKQANIWMLSTGDLERIRVRFIRQTRRFLKMMLEYYPYLENFVDARNKESIAWLKFCGATIEKAQPYGEEGLPFHHFYFRRK